MVIYHLPCKDHVKHYLEFAFGAKGKPVLMRDGSYIGKHFYMLVDDASTLFEKSLKKDKYTSVLPLKISQDIVLRKGCVLTRTNVRAFNAFVSDHFKTQIHTMLDALVEIKGMEIKKAIEVIYDRFDMDESILTHEAIRKDYQRHKKRLKLLKTGD